MGAKRAGNGSEGLPPYVGPIGAAKALTYKRRWPTEARQRHPELGEFFQRSLKTTDARTAWDRYSSVDQEFQRRCSELTTVTPQEKQDAWLAGLSDRERSAVVAYVKGRLQLPESQPTDARDAISRLIADLETTAKYLAGHKGVPVQLRNPHSDSIHQNLTKRLANFAADLRAFDFPWDSLNDVLEPLESAKPLTAEKLLEAWAAEVQPAGATLKKYGGAFRRIIQFLGFDDVRRITADDVVRFKAARLADGKTTGTVADDIGGAGAVCAWATTNRFLSDNPFAGLAPRATRKGPEPREPFDDADAAKLLIAARSESDWLRWLPWVLAFTGARISELVEMLRGDVRQVNGTWILDIKPNVRRQGKNDTFQRMLPLHPVLISEGFLDYVRALPADPTGPLFPSIPTDPRGSRVSPATTRHGEWVRDKVGIKNPSKAPAHSWRHRMEDELRRARVPEEVVDAITGRHHPRNAGAGYGKGYRNMPEEVLKELRKLPSPVQPIAYNKKSESLETPQPITDIHTGFGKSASP